MQIDDWLYDYLINDPKTRNLRFLEPKSPELFRQLFEDQLEIFSYLNREKETSKNFIKENILNIKSNIETNSLESHLSRIRKKMNTIKTKVKIQTKNEKLLINV